MLFQIPNDVFDRLIVNGNLSNFRSKISIVTFGQAEEVEEALAFDGFAIDDEEVSRPMRVLRYTEHLKG